MKFLQNLSYKTLFTILFLALAGIVFLLKISGKTQKVSAFWWDDSWHYRQAINISSHNSLESNVYITTAINIGTTTKAQTDDGDFRFISQSGENLSYYIVSGAGTTNVSFHILIPSFPSGTSTIYAYYGNSTIENGFSSADFSTEASNYTIGSLSSEEVGGGPIAYWKFDEGVGTTAYDSTGNFPGVLSGSTLPSWQNENNCISGKCLNYSGSGYINSGNSTNFRIQNNSITLETWVNFSYLDYTNNTGALLSLMGKGNPDRAPGTSSTGFWLTYDNRNNRNSFNYTCFGNSAGGYAGGNNNFSGYNYTFSPNIWYHIVVTISENQGRLYINGKQFGSTKTFTGLQLDNTSDNLFIGKANAGFNIGLQDEVKIYPYARTPDQIKQDYNSRGSLSGSSANLGIQSNTAPNLSSSLVGHWKFDESNGTTANNSVNGGIGLSGIFGTGNSAPTWSAEGKSNKSLNFNNTNSYIKITGLNTLNETTQFSASAWVKSNDVSQTQTIFSANPPFFLRISNSHFRIGIYTNSTWTFVNGNITLSNNKWHHLTLTYDGNQMKSYVDGNLDTSTNKTGTLASFYSTYIGYPVPGGEQNPFNGLIDEVKIYNTALTDEQIKQDYNQGSAISFGSTNQTIGGTTTSLDYCIPGDTSYCAPPVAEWKMDEGVGTSIIDTSGNSNTGTISGATFNQGKIGKSLSLNGTSDYVSIPTYSYTTNATISVWVKGSYANGNQIIVGSPNSIALGLYNSGSDKALIGFAGTLKAVGISNNFINDSWNQLTVTLDGSGNAIYYCNGQLLSNSGTNYWNWSNGTYIGRRDSGSYFKGQIDQLKIYNYARTPAQVAYDYNRGGPVGWWKMDECQGSTIYDWSGNGNNGTLTIGSNGTQNSIGTCQIGTSAAWTNGATGKFNSSLNFDGTDDYITMNTATNIPSGNADRTLSVWINSAGNGTTDMYPALWLGSTGTHNISAIGIRAATNFLCMTFWADELDSSIPATSGKWFHLLGTYVGSTREAKLYINGKFAVGKTLGSNLNTPANVYVSSSPDSRRFKGQIDDARIYNYALTEEQIKQVYNGGAVNFQ